MKDLSTINEIKEFIKWCRSNKIKSFQYNDLKFELSDFGFIEHNPIDQAETAQETIEKFNLDSNEDKSEEDALLYWSSNT